ncbi:replication termination factor 2 isoform X2 [Girardinichthys multiradiatus]|uniref:replication termination factor 2 isoform X2 n=1 Tax=Girardinichthys multiradiatus TaxID=208333 RepID=UPI001FABEFED|nr:replication termination factor 2 isoform X2 [Girardinichthys multiradiatus]
MGCDGGTIPKRHELVKGPKKVEKVDKNAELAAKWKYCALSQEKLRRPIVACELGRLYNKDAIIEYLLDKSAERPNAEAVTHIRGIKDINELNLTDNPEWEGERRNAKGDRYEDIHSSMFICPVVGLEMNGKHRFCYLQSCGCVFSDRALKEVKTEICHKCGDPFKDEDIVVLNGTKEEVQKLKEKMDESRAKTKTKKSKKSKAVETVSTLAESQEDAQPPPVVVSGGKPQQNGDESSQSAVAGPSGASSSSKGSKSSTAPATKRSFQDMKEKSEVFKSLFTTHSSAKRSKDQTSNWVTHTPYHF